jgi:hypothetical protein
MTVSKLFIAPMTTNSQGAPTLGAPILNASDDGTIRKGKPSIVQVGEHATIVFSGGASGKTQLMYTTYDPTITNVDERWSVIRSFSLGTGFEYANSPSIFARRYNGVNVDGLNSGDAVIEMSFVGKLRGRPSTEVFFARVPADSNGAPVERNGNPQFSLMPTRIQDLLESSDDRSTYQARGVAWNTSAVIRLEQQLNNTITNLEVADGSRVFNQATGILSFNTTLGGKVYIDTNIGTVRFASAVPSKEASLLLTYQPRFVRVSEPATAAGCSASSILFDNRQGSDASYWVSASGAALTNSDNDAIRSARYVFTYIRAAAGGGLSSRPYIRSLRLGVQCPSAIPTDSNGVVQGLTVSGSSGPYQVDAANGRIYFTDVDEYRNVTVNGVVYQVSFVAERKESPILVEQPVNEAGLAAFLDPLDIGGQIGARRPGLIWLLWSSTRSGSPDVYFETIAPRFSLLPAGN